MTKKTSLNWRLKELPDAVDVAELVDKKVITPEEARQLLFNENGEDTNKVKALEEEVKFLRELCDTLASKSNGWTTVIREYHDYKPTYPYWYKSYGTLMSTLGANTVNADLNYVDTGVTVSGAVGRSNMAVNAVDNMSLSTANGGASSGGSAGVITSTSKIKGLSSLNK